MTLTRPIVTLDIESTGTDVVQDRIIELACVVYNPDGTRKTWVQRFNPGFPIPAEVTAIHGITDADVADKPRFSEYAEKVHRGLQNRDLCGYNLRRFDLPILDEELRRCNLRLDLTGVLVIDAFGIFANKEPRNLEAAVQKYCGRSHEGAHGAAADAESTLDVFFGQLSAYEDLGSMSLEDVAKFSLIGDKQPADLAGKLYRGEDGDLRYNFGKCRDVKVKDDTGFCYWMLRQTSPPFPGSTCEILRSELGIA